MKFNIFKTLALGVLAMGFVACDEDFTKADYDAPIVATGILPEVTTGAADAFGESALIQASMTPVEGATITNWGVLVSTSATPTLAGSIKVEGDLATTTKTFAVTGLTDKTHYYYRSFVSDGVSVAYGETKEFTTNGDAWGVQQGYWSFATAADADNYLPYRAILGATHESAYGFTTCNMVNLYGSEFYGVVRGFSIDNTINQDEMDYITAWRDSNIQYSDHKEVSDIIEVINAILDDNIITLDEIAQLQKCMKEY